MYIREQIQAAVESKGYKWFESGDYNVNIVGVRNSDTNGRVTNKFDDKSAEWSDEEVCSRFEFENDFQGYLLRLSNFINQRLLETMGVRLNEKPN